LVSEEVKILRAVRLVEWWTLQNKESISFCIALIESRKEHTSWYFLLKHKYENLINRRCYYQESMCLYRVELSPDAPARPNRGREIYTHKLTHAPTRTYKHEDTYTPKHTYQESMCLHQVESPSRAPFRPDWTIKV
jgi:hypothetical protein